MKLIQYFLICISCFFSLSAHSQSSQVDSLKNLLKSELQDTVRIQVLNELSQNFRSNDPEQSIQLANEALELALEIDNKELQAQVHFNRSQTYIRMDVYDSAMIALLEAETAVKSTKEERLLIEIIREQGYVHGINGQMKDAFEKSFDVIRMLDSLDAYPDLNIHTLIDIGELYRSQQDGENAIKYYEKGRAIAMEVDNLRGMIRSDGNTVLALKQIGRLEEALAISRRMENDYIDRLNPNDVSRLYSNTGNILMDMERWVEAEEVLLKAWDIRKNLDFPRSKAYTLKELGYLYNETNRPELAVKYTEEAYHIVKEMNFPFLMRDITGTLSDAYHKTGNHKRAFEILKEQREVRDQLMETERLELSQEMEKKYEAEKREQQIALQDEQLATQEARLSQASTFRNALIGGSILLIVVVGLVVRNSRLKTRSLNEKEYLLKEIHHRVKNNLQVISSLLNMQSREANDPEMLDVIKEGQSRVKAMSLIHQKLYQTDNLSEIDFEEYSQQLIDQLAALYKRDGLELEKTINAKDIKLDIDTAIPLGLILNELISNSFKYAFNEVEKGELQISLERLSKEDLKLTVFDNGVGLPGSLDLTTVKSLGLKLVNILTKQLKGSMNFSNENGARFEIKFKDLRMSA